MFFGGGEDGSTNRAPFYTLAFALQQSKMTENVSEVAAKCWEQRVHAVSLVGMLSPSSTGLLISSRFRLTPQATLVGPWSSTHDLQVAEQGVPRTS